MLDSLKVPIRKERGAEIEPEAFSAALKSSSSTLVDELSTLFSSSSSTSFSTFAAAVVNWLISSSMGT